MSPLYVCSKVCMAPFNLQSQVCIAPIHVWSKVCKFSLHMDGSNADFGLHMEGSHADFTPRMERRNSFRDSLIAKIASFANLPWELFKITNILQAYVTYVTTFENKHSLRKVPLSKREEMWSCVTCHKLRVTCHPSPVTCHL